MSTEANIQQDMAKCRDAIQSGNWVELNGIVQGIAAKARRILEVGQTAVKNASDDSYKNTLSKAVHRLEKGIYRLLQYSNVNTAINYCSSHTSEQMLGIKLGWDYNIVSFLVGLSSLLCGVIFKRGSNQSHFKMILRVHTHYMWYNMTLCIQA